MRNKTIYNTLSSRGNEGSSGIEMFQQVYPELVEESVKMPRVPRHDKQPKTQVNISNKNQINFST